ncbi:MAG: YfbU family protein [Rhodospirillaceae bacterium]|nr:YfbU family protein [Rhodospirillaceae bacterium]
MPDNRVELTRLERLFLSNQYRILEALYPNLAEEYSVRREAIELGYELLYDWNADYIYDKEDILTRDEALEVWDTFDMFDSLKRSAEKLQKLDWLSSHFCSSFLGYDGNNETKFMAFAEFTIERLKRFQYIDLPNDKYYNSHTVMRPKYQKMLFEWKKIPSPSRFDLSEDQIKSILSVE